MNINNCITKISKADFDEIDETEYEFFQQIEGNHAMVYSHNSSFFIVPSFNPFSKKVVSCLRVSDEECLRALIQSEDYPIDDAGLTSVLEYGRDRLNEYTEAIGYYREYIEYHYSICVDSQDSLITIFEFVKEKTQEKDFTDLIAWSSLMFDFLSKEKGYEVKIRKLYGIYNPYYEPYFLNRRGFDFLLTDVVRLIKLEDESELRHRINYFEKRN